MSSDHDKCDNQHMPDDANVYPIAYSTAYLGLAALLTIRNNEDDDFDERAVEYATRILELMQRQPETILTLSPDKLEELGPFILDNAKHWPTK
jgi:hypothetical protein